MQAVVWSLAVLLDGLSLNEVMCRTNPYCRLSHAGDKILFLLPRRRDGGKVGAITGPPEPELGGMGLSDGRIPLGFHYSGPTSMQSLNKGAIGRRLKVAIEFGSV